MCLLCALSLLLVAFAHKPVLAPAAASGYVGVGIADYMLPDGTLPDLCLGGEEDGHHSGPTHCEACRIFASVDVPAPIDGFLINSLSPAQRPMYWQDEHPVRSILNHGASPRGPPLSLA